MRNNRVIITHDILAGTVQVTLDGMEVKTYLEEYVSGTFGMNTIMNDIQEFADNEEIPLSEDIEIVHFTR